MSTMVKSPNDGCWYYEETQWRLILEHLCNALESFSEADLTNELYIIIDHCADEVSKIIKK